MTAEVYTKAEVDALLAALSAPKPSDPPQPPPPAEPGAIAMIGTTAYYDFNALRKAAKPGDTIIVQPGLHPIAGWFSWFGQPAPSTGSGGTIRITADLGSDGKPIAGFDASAGDCFVEKAILSPRCNLEVENIILKGAKSYSANGAALRPYNTDCKKIVARNCVITDCQMGVQTGGAAVDFEIELHGCDLRRNGNYPQGGPTGGGKLGSHSIYIGEHASFTLLGAYVEGMGYVNEVKSRAKRNVIGRCQIHARNGRAIDLSEGGSLHCFDTDLWKHLEVKHPAYDTNPALFSQPQFRQSPQIVSLAPEDPADPLGEDAFLFENVRFHSDISDPVLMRNWSATPAKLVGCDLGGMGNFVGTPPMIDGAPR